MTDTTFLVVPVSSGTDPDGDARVYGTSDADYMFFEDGVEGYSAFAMAGDDEVDLTGADNRAYAGDGDDVVRLAGHGLWIWTGDGADTVVVRDGTADAVVFDFDITRDRLVFEAIAGLERLDQLDIADDPRGNAVIRFGSLVLKLKNVSAAMLASADLSIEAPVAPPPPPEGAEPVAAPDMFVTTADVAVTGNVLVDNGGGLDFDPDGGALEVVAKTGTTAAGGSVRIERDGALFYTPPPGFVGEDRFAYVVVDSDGMLAEGDVMVRVEPAPREAIVVSEETASGSRVYGTAEDDLMVFAEGAAGLRAYGRGGADRIVVTGEGNRGYGQGGDDTLVSAGSHDMLFLGAGRDTLVVTAASVDAAVIDFDPGEDRIILEGIEGVASFDDVVLTQVAESRLRLDAGAVSLLLKNVLKADLTAGNVQIGDAGTDAPPLPPAPPPDPETGMSLQLLVSTGQSLSVGATSNRYVVSTEPAYPDRALGLGFGVPELTGRGWQTTAVDPSIFQGLVSMTEHPQETHASAMVAQYLARQDAAGAGGSVLHYHVGAGGRSVLELMTRPEDIHQSVEAGLAATSEGGVFAVALPNSVYEYYVNAGGVADFYLSRVGDPVFYTNFIEQLALGRDAAAGMGYQIETTIGVAFIQGQSDSGTRHDTYGYDHLLRTYFERLDAGADAVMGTDVDVLPLISQTRGYSAKQIAIDQIAVAQDPGYAFGATEYQYQMLYPSMVGSDYTHLSPEGYYALGAHLGERMADALAGTPDAPILMSGIAYESARQVLVRFTGVDGGLVDDPSIYVPEHGLVPPSHFGFRLYSEKGFKGSTLPEIVSAQIVGEAEVRLTFDGDLAPGLRLYLGRNEENLLPELSGGQGFGGTTLRSADSVTGIAPPNGGEAPVIHEYAPIQYVTLPDLAAAGMLPGMDLDGMDVLV